MSRSMTGLGAGVDLGVLAEEGRDLIPWSVSVRWKFTNRLDPSRAVSAHAFSWPVLRGTFSRSRPP